MIRHSSVMGTVGRGSGIDRVFLTLIVVEVVFGFIMLASASGPLAFSHFHDTWHFAKHQLFFGILPGLVIMLIAARVPYKLFNRFALPLFVVSLVVMVLVFIPGIAADYGTARSWIFIAGTSIQPTEILKITFILYIAALFSRRADTGGVRAVLMPAGIVFVAVAALLLPQPDLGSLILFAGVLITLTIAARVPVGYILAALVAALGVLIAFARMAPYRSARLTVFLHPELDPQGIGYQINQALLAIGSGGLLGLGLGHSRQKFQYLPQVMNDSIFPVIAEELGFFFALGLIVLIVAIFLRSVRIARECADPFGRLVVLGIMGWLTIQAFLNIGAMLGLLPLTGLPLPFVSYGGTAMVASLAAVGIVLNISRNSASRL